ncbi:hypothetical protein DQQ10_06180 [Pseudochryseolinea flava]|uniref:HEAT repeat domain-containing protein n=1 Tax=Pseudochryseolinea flava TaxID=2059302 RepID=A0A364Y5A6_9BACT|nr:hypothetical protein DQQ10_06180 [Pseudochryseolinea flava]
MIGVYFAELRSGNNPSIPKQISYSENANASLKAITPYLKDTATIVRARAYTLTNLAGANAKNETARTTAVLQLISACRDKDAGNVGQAMDYLKTFRPADFNTVACDSMRKLFRDRPAHYDKLIQLIGFVDMPDMKELIRTYTRPGTPRDIRWSAIISLVRMNDNDALYEMMSRVQNVTLNNDVVYEIFPDLVYTRHRMAITYLVNVMRSDEKNCMTADAEREVAIPCGYRIMEMLAPAIENYPLQLDESGDVITKDYVKALQTVREWFSKNPSYVIRKDTY